MSVIKTISIPEELSDKLKKEKNVSELICNLLNEYYSQKTPIGIEEIEEKINTTDSIIEKEKLISEKEKLLEEKKEREEREKKAEEERLERKEKERLRIIEVVESQPDLAKRTLEPKSPLTEIRTLYINRGVYSMDVSTLIKYIRIKENETKKIETTETMWKSWLV